MIKSTNGMSITALISEAKGQYWILKINEAKAKKLIEAGTNFFK
ncbi:hypothetical protein [Winogradskyella echinorum]|nr:hypothetical protein [Winogradskyella echinorum]